MTVPVEASITTLVGLMEAGALRSADLVEHCIERITAEDSSFNSVAFLNNTAVATACDRDRDRDEGRVRGPLHGMPILLKDNISTGDGMMTTAGSLALDGIRMACDSHIAMRLRQAGAVLLGKTNLSEWANFRSKRSSSGWSSRGGQVRNAYAIDRTPGGSSSGSAVAVARGFVPAAIGTETDGSIVGPAAMNSIVGIKPTVGLVGRTGIIPIAASQDTAGPMARTVADAAIVLGVISGFDHNDAATRLGSAADFGRVLDPAALRDARIGAVRSCCGFHDGVDAVFDRALTVLAEAGATVVDDIVLPVRDEIRPYESVVMLTEFKVGLNAWLSALGAESPVHSLADLIAYNEAHARDVMPYFGQELLIEAETTDGLGNEVYRKALAVSRRLTRDNGIDRAIDDFALDALVAPTSPVPWAIDPINGDNRLGGSSYLAAVSGYPSVTVPAGYVAGLPVGLSFIGSPWRDGTVIGYAHAFEQTAGIRVPPEAVRRWIDTIR